MKPSSTRFGQFAHDALLILGSLKALSGIVSAGLNWAELTVPTYRGLPAWPQALQVIAYLATGLFLRIASRSESRARNLALTFVLCACAFSNRLLRDYGDSSPGTVGTLAVTLPYVTLGAFIPFALWSFASTFPRVPLLGFARQYSLFMPRFSMTVGVGFFLVFLSVLLPSAGGVLQLPPEFIFGIPFKGFYTIYWAAQFALILPALAFVVWRARRAPIAERRRGRLFIAGLVLGIAPIGIEVFLEGIIPPFYRFMMDQRNMQMGAFVIYPALLSVPITTTYAILVHKALDVRLVIRRAIQYAVARTTVLVVMAAPLVALTVHLFTNRELPLVEFLQRRSTIILILAAMVAAGLYRFRLPMLTALDRRFYREQYDAHMVLSALVHNLRRVENLSQLSNLVRDEIMHAMHASSTYVLFAFDPLKQLREPSDRFRSLSLDSPIISLVKSSTSAIRISPETPDSPITQLPETEREWLSEGCFELLVPIHGSRSKDILGLIALGEKRSELPYSRSDRALLEDVAVSAAYFLEHSLERDISPAAAPVVASKDLTNVDEAAKECSACGLISRSSRPECSRCGGEMKIAFLPYQIDNIRIIRRVGAGGMGVVYLGQNQGLALEVAVKTLPKTTPKEIYRLTREARTMAAIQHPNLASIFDMKSWRGIPVLIMEFLEGGTLVDRCAKGQASVSETIEFGRTVASALEFTHAKGVMHRDIKPSNIGFDGMGTLKILDFGIAHIAPGTSISATVGTSLSPTTLELTDETITVPANTATILSTGGYIVGTPRYMSPEALRGETPSGQFDLWALAVVMFEMLTGSFPYAVSHYQAYLRRGGKRPTILSLERLCPECPPELSGYLAAALSFEPNRRPANAAEFRRGLENISAVGS